MNEEQQRKSGGLIALLLLGWEASAGLIRTAARIFMEKAESPRPTGTGPTGTGTAAPPSSPEEIRRAAEAEKRQAETGAVLMLGGIVGWKLGKSLLRRAGNWLLGAPRGPKGPGGGAGAPTIDAVAMIARKAAEARESQRDKPAAIEDAIEHSKEEREQDRNLDAENGVDLTRRERWGTGLVMIAFLASVAGGIGFVVTYWTGGPNEYLGGGFALFFGGLGVAAVIAARWLTVHKEAVEQREEPSSTEEHEAAAVTFQVAVQDIHRRKLLGWIAAGGAAVFGAMFITLFRSLGFSPNPALYSTVWKHGQRLMTLDGKPISADALTPGSTTVVFPEGSIGSEKAQTVLIRVDPALVRLPPDRSHWAPMGNLAYSRICTHAGCSVGMYETTTHQLMCPCHQSTFDVLRGAEPTGGPAARPLPQLPLYTDSDGNLRAGGGFTKPPGPGFWGIPS